MSKYVFYSHAGSGNHGCEAIVRSSKNIIQESITLYSMNENQDKQYGLNNIVMVDSDADNAIRKYSKEWFYSRIQTKLFGLIDREIFYRKKVMLSNACEGDIWFSIGGDNYCYPGTEILAAENKILLKRGVKTVLWGCSVEPLAMEQPQIAKDISQYCLITARESISYQALRKVNKNTILVSDPAFTLKRVDLPLPDGWINGQMIGINASPLILQNAKNSKLAFNSYCRLIETILNKTNYSIALIPHVVWESNDDRKPLRKLYELYKDSKRVLLVEDHNCMELKGYIARCRMFIGARTHATIAAYSTCVPTLVLGYSVKSRGIARDLFGAEEKYVLSVQSLQYEDELANRFLWLMENEERIRIHLEKIIPAYVQRAYFALDALNRLTEKTR